MQKYETTLTIPCNIGDSFWIFDNLERKAVRVECTAYVISRDEQSGRDVAYIWVDSIDGRGQWNITFNEFYSRCFKTRKEAEKSVEKRRK